MQRPVLSPSLLAAGVVTTVAATCAAGGAFAETGTDPASGNASAVVAVVEVPRPWYAPRFVVVSKMRDTVPQYERLPGLTYKAFTLTADGGRFGGIYLWADRAQAEAWFSPAWFARVEKERGAKGEVRFFDAPVVLDNSGGARVVGDTSVATIVTIPTPPGVTRERLVAEFQAALPTDRRVDGLLRKYFIVTADGRFGGVYLWRARADADRWFDAAWHERVRRTYHDDAALEWFDAPILLPGVVPSAPVAALPR